MGYSISIEGGDGTGKSTVIAGIEDYLRAVSIDYILTREPGGVRISEAIRDIILDKEYREMDARTEALLFAAARRQHFVQKILPNLEDGKLVIIDRFIDSSIVYQGIARKIGADEVERINDFAILGFRPNLTIVLDIDIDLALRRIASNPNREINKLDLEERKFHQRVRGGYLELISENSGGRFVRVDASGSPEEVLAEVLSIVEKNLLKWYNLVK